MLRHELSHYIRRMKELKDKGNELSDPALVLFNDRKDSQRYYKGSFARGIIILSNYIKQKRDVGERIQDSMTFVYDRLNPEILEILFDLENLGRKIDEREFIQRVILKYLPSLPTQTPEEELSSMFNSKLRAKLETFRREHSLDYKLLKYLEYLKTVPPHCIPFPCSDGDLIKTYGTEERKEMDEIRREVYSEVGFLAVNERIRHGIVKDIWRIAGLEERIEV